MLAAMCEACAQAGPGHVSVTEVVARSGVSRRTFYEIFADREHCLRAALEEALRRAAGRVVPAHAAERAWRQAIRAGVQALLEFIEEEPAYARLLIVDALAAGDAVLAHRAEVLDALAEAVDRGRLEARASRSTRRSAAEGVVGGVLAILHTRLINGGAGVTPELGGELMALVLAPYLGASVAAREIERGAPSRPVHVLANGSNPLSRLPMRLTHRTVLVLHAVAGQPGSSNRQIADLAGIADQGQASKLLRRLAAIGLIENPSRASARGEPNAWTLTGDGVMLERAIAAQRGR